MPDLRENLGNEMFINVIGFLVHIKIHLFLRSTIIFEWNFFRKLRPQEATSCFAHVAKVCAKSWHCSRVNFPRDHISRENRDRSQKADSLSRKYTGKQDGI